MSLARQVALSLVAAATWSCGEVEDVAFLTPSSPREELPAAGLLLWLSADQGIDKPSVGLWRDRSGNRQDATQLDEAARPTLATASWTSLPVVQFTLSSKLLLPNLSLTEGFTALMVLRDAPGGAGRNFAVFGNTAGHIELGAEGEYFYFESIGAPRSYQPAVLSAALDSKGHAEFYVGGALAGEGDPGLEAGVFSNNHLGPTTSEIGELIVYGRALDRGEREAVESYLQTKWSCCTL